MAGAGAFDKLSAGRATRDAASEPRSYSAVPGPGDRPATLAQEESDRQVLRAVSVGGFLGIGARDAAVPLDELQLGEEETYLMTAASEDQLKLVVEI